MESNRFINIFEIGHAIPPGMISCTVAFLCILSIVGFSKTGYCESVKLGNLQIIQETTVKAEYDDNIRLANDIDEKAEDDYVIRLMPNIVFRLPYEDHRFSIGITGDYRKGIDSDLSDLNIVANGEIDLNFTGGLKFKISDTYSSTRFDEALEGEPGISKSQSNITDFETAYTFAQRLLAEGKYRHRWDDYEDEYATTDYQRTIDTVNAKLALAVTKAVVAYTAYMYETQDSDEKSYQNYDDNRYVAGVEWNGKSRLKLWGEAGYEEIDFEDPTKEDFDNPVGKMGFQMDFTDSTSLAAAFGWNGYGNFIANAKLHYLYNDGISTYLSAERKTNVSFASENQSTTFESTNLILKQLFTIVNRVVVTLEGRLEYMDSFSDEESREDKIWIGKVNIEYLFRNWVRFGVHYMYANRDSNIDKYEYNNNRVGMFVTLGF